MSLDYVRLAAQAVSVLKFAGVPNCRLLRVGASASDPAKPWAKDVVDADEIIAQNFSAVVPNETYRRGKITARAGLDQSGSGDVILPATVVGAEPGDVLEATIDGVATRWILGRVEPIAPGGILVVTLATIRS